MKTFFLIIFLMLMARGSLRSQIFSGIQLNSKDTLYYSSQRGNPDTKFPVITNRLLSITEEASVYILAINSIEDHGKLTKRKMESLEVIHDLYKIDRYVKIKPYFEIMYEKPSVYGVTDSVAEFSELLGFEFALQIKCSIISIDFSKGNIDSLFYAGDTLVKIYQKEIQYENIIYNIDYVYFVQIVSTNRSV